MKLNYEKLNKAYKKFVKWFGIIVISMMYIAFIVHLIIEKDIVVFLGGVIVTTIMAFIWRFAIKVFVR